MVRWGVERELTCAVDIADGDGRLRRDAVGWSRHPNQRCNLPAGVARGHAFDYWCAISRTAAVTFVVADVGIAGVALVSVLDLASGRTVERVYARPRGLPARMPASPHGECVLDGWRLHLVVGPERLVARARTITGHRIDVDLAIERPPGHETVNVLVPWDDERFHFTSKQQALPARGTVIVDGHEHRFAADTEAFACRDFGRGRWPQGIDWCWAFASARRGGRTLGLNLGGGWTEGTGVTENAIVIDGRVHKIAEAVDFTFDARDRRRPWWIRSRGSARVDLTFTPRHVRAVAVPLLVRLRQCVGTFAGTVVDDGGAPIELADVVGLAETVRGRW
jgi:hypothetical protein